MSQYLSGTFAARAAANTSVVFAFELAKNLTASFSVYITAPCDVEFPTLCEASVGPDVLESTLPAQVTKYISFPDAMSVACTGNWERRRPCMALPRSRCPRFLLCRGSCTSSE